jgi:iron complex outermembrane receptor protein
VAVNANSISNPNLFVQQAQNQSRGIEAVAAGNILPNLSVILSWAYNVAKVTESKIDSQVGTIVENAPRYSTTGWIKYTFNKGTIKGLGIMVGHSAVSVRYTLEPGIQLPAYLLLNTGLNYNL